MDDWLKVLLFTYGLSLLAIVDMFRFRPATWAQARQIRPLWVLLVILLNLLGVLLYATGPRLVLRRTVREFRERATDAAVAA
ncbi:MAG: PLDc N-terminal domain-containing protein [Propionibacteriales bacterium]|nr:PLDc N-terminal domain-containing protein [Propionibacteriales bacterium]